ncbi:MAG: DEAD/DEAH box helicase [Bifidobacteriaceae bacterium]|jgi:ATP-dependent DNA helicase RecG|nr:DEAD/DEAH box helicase [Bifidobacteriaceae bacterium]
MNKYFGLYNLDSPLSRIKEDDTNNTGLTTRRINQFKKADINILIDLLYYFPFRYEQPYELVKIQNLELGSYAILAELEDCEIAITKGKSRLELKFKQIDKSIFGDIPGTKIRANPSINNTSKATFFSTNTRYLFSLKKDFIVGQNYIVYGQTNQFNDQFNFTHPKYKILDQEFLGEKTFEDIKNDLLKPSPVYHKQGALTTNIMQKTMHELIPFLEENWSTHVETDREEYKYINEWFKIIKHLHIPNSIHDYENAREEFKKIEALILQISFKKLYDITPVGVAEKFNINEKILNDLINKLPYKLSPSQINAIDELNLDLANDIPMNRILQGDVGSGKTVVCLMSALTVLLNENAQVTFTAPTQLLANQHYQSITSLITKLKLNDKVKVGLLTGNIPEKHKQILLDDIKNGKVNLIIGTHSVLSDSTKFYNLAYSIIDEFHKFGVDQREKVTKPVSIVTNKSPHSLIVSATPIPRSVVKSLMNHIKVTTIKKPEIFISREITTNVVSRQSISDTNKMWETAVEYINSGKLVFVVAPHVKVKVDLLENNADSSVDSKVDFNGDSDAQNTIASVDSEVKNTIASVESVFEKLTHSKQFENFKIGKLHGSMDSDEKEKTIKLFSNHKIELLICSSIVEVGIDIKDADLMIILDANYFGASSLHQIRGRIGRGKGTSESATTQTATDKSVAVAEDPVAYNPVPYNPDPWADEESQPAQPIQKIQTKNNELKPLCFFEHNLESNLDTDEDTDEDLINLKIDRLQKIANTNDGFQIALIDLQMRGEGDITGSTQHGKFSNFYYFSFLKDYEIFLNSENYAVDFLNNYTYDDIENYFPFLEIFIKKQLDANLWTA